VVNIARYLNAEGVKSKTGKKWKFTVVHHILTNPTYTGIIARGGERVTGAHKPIIKEEAFEQVKEALPLRKLKPRRVCEPNLFTGFIFCGCGAPMHMSYPGSESKAKYKYYACSRRLDYKDCALRYIRADILEISVINELKKLSEDKPRIQAIVNDLKEENRKPSLLSNRSAEVYP